MLFFNPANSEIFLNKFPQFSRSLSFLSHNLNSAILLCETSMTKEKRYAFSYTEKADERYYFLVSTAPR